jgi:hypothetical protein
MNNKFYYTTLLEFPADSNELSSAYNKWPSKLPTGFSVSSAANIIHTVRFVWDTYYDLLNIRSDLLKTDIFRKFIIRHWQLSSLLFINCFLKIVFNKLRIKNWQCCLKRRPWDAKIFQVNVFACVWERTVEYSRVQGFVSYLNFAYNPLISGQNYS